MLTQTEAARFRHTIKLNSPPIGTDMLATRNAKLVHFPLVFLYRPQFKSPARLWLYQGRAQYQPSGAGRYQSRNFFGPSLRWSPGHNDCAYCHPVGN